MVPHIRLITTELSVEIKPLGVHVQERSSNSEKGGKFFDFFLIIALSGLTTDDDLCGNSIRISP